jgi:hypothetical protein
VITTTCSLLPLVSSLIPEQLIGTQDTATSGRFSTERRRKTVVSGEKKAKTDSQIRFAVED